MLLIYFLINICLFFKQITQIYAKECPEMRVLQPYKTRTWIIEGIQIHNSTIRLLRGGSQPGTTDPVNNIMIWDMATNNMLKIFDIDIQITKMLYCKKKRKLLALGIHKILNIHLQNFSIIDEYNIGGSYIEDVEDSESLLLMARDQGNPFIYDIYERKIVETLPYEYLNIKGQGWASQQFLKDFTILLSAKLILFDKNDGNRMISFLQSNVQDPELNNQVCSFKSANFLITGNLTNIVSLGMIYRDQQGKSQYQSFGFYQEPTISGNNFIFVELYCIMRGSNYFVVGTLGNKSNNRFTYNGATVLKIESQTDPITNQVTYFLKVQEQWRYRRWRKDMEFFLFDEGTHRGHSISEYEHYSYEFLESDVGQCDFDGDGVIDPQCRVAKTISHWPWNLNIGVFSLGSNSEYYIHANDNIMGYQIRDWNQTEIARIKQPRLIEKKQYALRRVQLNPQSTYTLSFDTYIQKMNWVYNGDMKPGFYQNAGFYIYQQISITQNQTDTYNLISYMNPSENSNKYLNPYDIITAFTYKDLLHVCVYYNVLEVSKNENGDDVNNQASYLYFSSHNKECYRLSNGQVLYFNKLIQSKTIEYGQGVRQYSKCTPFYYGGYLVCKHKDQLLEFWSLDNYTLVKTFPISNCPGDLDIAAHRSRIFVGCDNSIIIYDDKDQSVITFDKFQTRVILYLIVSEDILIVAYSTIEIMVYDLRPSDGSIITVFQYYNPQDCCIINSIDINPKSKRIVWAATQQINQIDLTNCFEDPQNCLTCEINSYFKFDPNFSFLKQKYQRAQWPTAQPSLYVNPKFLDSGFGTMSRPYQTDMNIIQLYLKTELYKSSIVNFKSITLNIYIDTSKEFYMSHHIFFWVHDKTQIKFLPWDSSSQSNQKVKIVINSPLQIDLTIQNWDYIDMRDIQAICPNCNSNSLTLSNSGQVYLRNFILSKNLNDLTNSQQSNPDQTIQNIRIQVNNVDVFSLENQVIQNIINDDLNTVPFFTFYSCKSVILKNLVFQNIVNQESLFESLNSSFLLDTITFSKINTCEETVTQRTKFNLIPFKNFRASNIKFLNNQFCDICLLQSIASSSDQNQNLISISNVEVSNNSFNSYVNSNVIFLKMSLVQLIQTSPVAIEISKVNFINNKGNFSNNGNCYYFEFTKINSVTMNQINILDESLVGIASFNKIQTLQLQYLSLINSQYMDNTLNKNIYFDKNVILFQEIEKIEILDSYILGMNSRGIVTVQIEESNEVSIRNLTLNHSSFRDSLFVSISNQNNQISSISIQDSNFDSNQFSTQQSYIQVGLIQIKAEKSSTSIQILNSTFTKNSLAVNQNTQKKSSLAVSIENSISDVTISNCTFYNYLANGIIGDLFLNVQYLTVFNSTFQQNLTGFIDPSQNKPNLDYEQTIFAQFDIFRLKGAFLQLQVQQVKIIQNSFSNAISQQGAVFIQPNNNFLLITVENSNFTNLYASQSGTAFYVSSMSSPTNINIKESLFQNLWLGNQAKQSQAHLFFESSSLNQNQIDIKNIEFYNFGKVKLINQETTNSYFLYSDSFHLNVDSIYLLKKKNRSLMTNLFDSLSKSRITQQINDVILFNLLGDYIFYGSSIIYSSQGTLDLTNVELLGSLVINDKYINTPKEIQQANIITTQSSTVKVNNLKIFNFNVNINGGLILIQNSKSAQLNNINLTNVSQQISLVNSIQLYQESSEFYAFVNCLNSECSIDSMNALCDGQATQICQGRVINSYKGSLSLTNSNFSKFQLQDRNGTALFIQDLKSILLIEQCTFNNLQSEGFGAAIYFYQSDLISSATIKIIKSTFKQNVVLKYGGAIALEGSINDLQQKINISENKFIQNEAQLSGAIYYSSFYLNPTKVGHNIFENNKAKMGNDVYSMPSNLSVILTIEENQTVSVQNSGEYTIIQGSGLQLPKIQTILYYEDHKGQQHAIDPSLISQQKEILEMQMSLDKKNPVKFEDQNQMLNYFMRGNLYSSYNQEQNSISFSNIELYGLENSEVYLMITSPLLKKKKIAQENGNIVYDNYKFIINIRFRGCSKFEIVTSNQISQLNPQINKCQVCPDLSYSKNKEVCEQCQIGAICKANQELSIKSGYWRDSYDSYTVLQCSSGSESCKGGQSMGNELCETGYIGPLCQECDLFSIRGSGRYSRLGKSLCRNCQFDFVSLIMVLGTVVISLYLTIRAIYSISNYLKAQILVKFMKAMKFKRIREVDQLQSQNILIKILMTYFQLISIIRTIEIKIPNLLPEISFYFGNPATNSTMNINCLFPEFFIGMHYIYYNYFLSLFVPILDFFVLALTLKVLTLIKKEKLSISDLKAGIIFFFTYFQPEFVYQAIQLMTCKSYGGKKYNQANTSIGCSTEPEYLAVLSLLIIIFCFFIPLLLFLKLSAFMKNKKFSDFSFQLQNCQYAFLSINYKTQIYYWEFIRMSERLLFILIASIFNSNQTLKILLLIFISEGYCYILRIKQPFKNQQFNTLEIATNHIICVSFLLAIGIYSEDQSDALNVLFYVIFLIINWLIIAYILMLVMQEQVNKITDKMLLVVEKNKYIRCLFENFLHCLNFIPFFRLNFDLKLYLSKKKKPLLYEKVRQALLQLLKLPQEDRNIFFLSIKEQKNQSKYISNMMNQFKNQFQNTSPSKSNQSPQQSLQNKLEKIIVSQSDQDNEASFATKNKNCYAESKTITQINLFSSFRNQNNQPSFINNFFGNKDKSIVQSVPQPQQNLNKKFYVNSQDLELSNLPKDETILNQFSPHSKTDIQSSLSELRQGEQQLYQFPVQKIQVSTDHKQYPSVITNRDYNLQDSVISQTTPYKDSIATPYKDSSDHNNENQNKINGSAENFSNIDFDQPQYLLQSYQKQLSNIIKNQRNKKSLLQSAPTIKSSNSRITYKEDFTNNNDNNINDNSID